MKAFPSMPPVTESGYPPPGYGFPEEGMDLRDWFAGMALQGYISTGAMPAWDPIVAAKKAYAYADAMLEAREK